MSHSIAWLFILVLVVLGTTKAAPVPFRSGRVGNGDGSGECSSPFIQGLPGWKPWYGIGPVVRPIREYQCKIHAKWPTEPGGSQPAMTPSPVEAPSSRVLRLPWFRKLGKAVPPPEDPVQNLNEGELGKRYKDIGIKGWNPLFGKGPILYPLSSSERVETPAPAESSDAPLPYGLGP